MLASTALDAGRLSPLPQATASALLRGEILLSTETYTAWGAAVTAQMYLPLNREKVWQQLADYPRWVQYFPDITQSRILHSEGSVATTNGSKRLYQAASKTFLFLTAQVEVYLQVFETLQQRIEFRLESGSFTDFFADLKLKDFMNGTLLTYFVRATPTIPIPGVFIQQAIHFDLPTNMQTMRKAICP